jgi:hypothetical protein
MDMPRPRRKLDDYTKLLITLFLVPAPFEIAVGIVKREQYDYRRLVIIGATLAGLAVLLAVLRRRTWWYPQVIVGYYVLAVGLVVTGGGIAATVWSDAIRALTRWSSGAEVAVTALAPSLGILLVASGIYLVRDRRKRATAELDTPLPDRIDRPRTVPLNRRTSAVWTSDDPTRQRGRDTLVGVAQGYLDVQNLHYVAYFSRSGECDFYVDLFDDDALALLATGDTGLRRANYARHGRHIRHLITKLDGRLSDLHTGRLVRVVLDVEKGAILYYDLGNQGFLVGVTLDQRQVDPADWKMSDLANAILRAFGQQEDDDFYRLCPRCGQTNRAPATPLPSDGTVIPLQRPRTGPEAV